MALLTQGPKGTQDILPAQTIKWQAVEDAMRKEAAAHGCGEIRTPVFEHTELFQRGVGDTTDIVQKQMYTFLDKGGRSVTLRPEGTAGVVRSMLQHALYNEGYPVRLYYFTSCYRYEKPQAGRWREFQQFGVEFFGSNAPVADAEVISIAHAIFERLQIRGLQLEINSVGCPKCRPVYHQALTSYFNTHQEALCGTCQERLIRNPMRILDCKSPVCAEIAAKAPPILDSLCDDCRVHFQEVQACLSTADIAYTVNPSIVRGLDYYTNTVFEFITSDLGAQSAVCGGGRYNGLTEEIGGKEMPALGFAIGLSRIMLLLEAQQIALPAPPPCMLYVASVGARAAKEAFRLKTLLQQCSVIADCDLCERSLKAQMKYADKIGAQFTMVLGEEELENGFAMLKNMKNGEKTKISLQASFLQDFAAATAENLF